MSCMEREQLFALAHGMLDPQEQAAVRTHVAECARCRQEVEEFARLDAVLDEWQPAEPSPWFDTRLRAAIAAEGEGGWRKALGVMQWVRWLVPAAAVAAFVLWLVVTRQPGPPPVPVAHKTPAVQKSTPAPEVAHSEAEHESAPVVQAQNPPAPANRALQTRTDETAPEDDLRILEDYDMLANFDVLSELPQRETRVAN
jgi:anti-sigma factor RsiW